MSSSFNTDTEPSTSSQLLSNLPPGIDAQNASGSRRHAATMNPYPTNAYHSWSQRDSPGHLHAGPSSPSPSSSRPTFSGYPEPSRYGVAPAPFPVSDMPVEARRQSMMAMDRKRRLTGSAQDSGRRRNIADGFDDHEDPQYSRGFHTLPSSSRPPATPRRQYTSVDSGQEVIDLTSSPSEAADRSESHTQRGLTPSSAVYVVPRWQPDSEIDHCPICKRPFTFLFRRHHCRKCGRVVCNDCSPHRITIPRQFIVNPPGPYGQLSPGRGNTIDLTGDDEDDEDEHLLGLSSNLRRHRHIQNPALGGGAKVRLCNPCVPDPQPEPQPNYGSTNISPSARPERRDDLLTLSDVLRSSRQDFSNSRGTEPFPGLFHQYPQPSNSQTVRTRPFSISSHPPNSMPPAAPPSSLPFLNERHRIRPIMPGDVPQTVHHRHHSTDHPRTPSHTVTRPRHRSMLDQSHVPRVFSGPGPSFRPRLNEEDICPICRRALPPKGADGDETAREAHIMECISARDPSTQALSSRSLDGSSHHARAPMHMLPFVATEKDCVGEDGNAQECSICMVEYDVGDHLARLECLCKFHKECISEWFERKQECPVHKIT